MDATRFHQVVPRPAGVRSRTHPNWPSDLTAADSDRFHPEIFRAKVASELSVRTGGDSVSSAVLLGCFDLDGEVGIVLTRRAAALRNEPLTVSLPGGRVEVGESAVEAALREAEEEIGLGSEALEVLGCLRVVSRRSDHEQVLPVVAWLGSAATLSPNPDEVDEVLRVPLRALVQQGIAWIEEWGEEGEARSVRFFADEATLGRDLVWGLTARMIWELIELASGEVAS